MRFVVRFLFVFVSVLAFYSFERPSTNLQETDSYVYWNSRKLTWDDFSGEVPENSKFSALTHSAISLDFVGEGISLKFTIETIFDQSKSWKKKGVNKYVLNHEQIHFDITEYHARLLRKDLKNHTYSSLESIGEDVRNMFEKASNAANEMQLLYDEQTNHSLNKKKQAKWNKKMKKYLSSTSTYKNPIIKVNVSYLNR